MDIYQNRNEYRTHVNGSGISRYRITIKETDLFIASSSSKTVFHQKETASEAIYQVRSVIEAAIRKDPEFLHSLHPLDLFPEDLKEDDSARIIRQMKQAGLLSHVGPMASVAGMISEYTGRALLKEDPSATVIIENGGDIFLQSPEDLTVEIHAPGSPLSDRLALKVSCKEGLGVCTSSGTYGHSLSFGKSQAAVVVSADTALADAAATRLGNLLKDSGRIEEALTYILQIPGVLGSVAIVDDKIGFMGDIQLVSAG